MHRIYESYKQKNGGGNLHFYNVILYLLKSLPQMMHRLPDFLVVYALNRSHLLGGKWREF